MRSKSLLDSLQVFTRIIDVWGKACFGFGCANLKTIIY